MVFFTIKIVLDCYATEKKLEKQEHSWNFKIDDRTMPEHLISKFMKKKNEKLRTSVQFSTKLRNI